MDKFGRQAAAYMKEIATTYDTFGKAILKASQSIHPDNFKIPNTNTSDNEIDSNEGDGIQSFTDKTQSCFGAIRTTGSLSQGLAKYYTSQVVARLTTVLSDNRNVLETHGRRYVASRTQCMETRNRALAARSKYFRAIRSVEKAFRQWQKARDAAIATMTEDVDTTITLQPDAPEWEKPIRQYGKVVPKQTDLLVTKLEEMEAARVRYEELVDVENDAVTYANEMESAALDAMQGVENDRIRFFLESVVKSICEVDESKLQRLPVSQESFDLKGGTVETTSIDLKKGKDLLANIFIRQTISYEEGMGRTDAETLGLPIATGQFRDNVKKQVSIAAALIKASQTLVEFLDSLGSALILLEAGLKTDSTPSNPQQQPLGAMAFNAIGPIAAEMFKGLVQIHEAQSTAAKILASTLANLSLEKLERPLESAQRDLRAEKDFDDTNWKTLCEIARTESKAAARYRQVRAQQEKARERLQSADSTGTDDMGGSSTPQKGRMSKALFAGGEAMKKFQENARLAIAKSNLNEAEQVAAKEQQTLDEATATKSQAILEYKRVTETRIMKLEATNKKINENLATILDSIQMGMEQLNQARTNALSTPLDGGNRTYEVLMQDVAEWLQSAKDRIEANRKIAVINEEENQNNGNSESYRLSVVLSNSELVNNLLCLRDIEEQPPAFITNVDNTASESSDDERDVRAMDSSVDTNGSVASRKSFSQEIPTPEKKTGTDPSMPVTITEDTKRIQQGGTATTKVVGKNSPVEHKDSTAESSMTGTSTPHASYMNAFIQQFWNENDAASSVPQVLQVISCSYRPKEKAGFLIPVLLGRLFTTTDKLYFLALDGKSFSLSWDDIVAIAKEKGFMGGGDSALLVTYKTTDSDASFVLSRLENRDSVLLHLQDLLNQSKNRGEPQQEDDHGIATVPEDDLLKKMTIVLSKSLRGVSIKEVYEKAWSEGNRTSEKPFYGPWLDTEECFDINVEDWEFAEPGSDGFIGPWCNERYTQRRLTTFKFKRTSHLYIGPPVAHVKQMHYCRVEGNDRCIVAISATIDGVPYSDTFVVEMRWVARRHGDNDLDVKVGLEVDFKKNTMLKSQIKAGTLAETTNVHVRMFDAIRRLCGAQLDVDEVSFVESSQVEDIAYKPKREGFFLRFRNSLKLIPVNPNFLLFAAATLSYPVIWNFFSALLGAPGISMDEARRLNLQIQELRQEVQELRRSIDVAVDLLKKVS